ncbi:hypothetical protein [Haladaptatus sp. ZSTT2]|uniref:hypothetical protein n=1 Tax=Haladaptatus sp. ZSTT2 TaxID=3120515 RepID=UPI00300E9672
MLERSIKLETGTLYVGTVSDLYDAHVKGILRHSFSKIPNNSIILPPDDSHMEVYRIDDENLSQLEEQELPTEKKLEEYLIRSDGAQIGGVNVLYIGQQGSPGEGGIFDILGVDEQGDIVIIELKRERTPRDIVAQALEYAASIRSEEYPQLDERYREFVDDEEASLLSKHTEYFSRVDDPLTQREFNTDQRLLLVGTDFSELSLDMADFLREHGIDVVCVTFGSFTTDNGDLKLLTTEAVRRPLSAEPASVSGGRSSSSRETTIEICDGDKVIKTFEERNQSDAMEVVVSYLIDEHNLLNQIPIPYLPGSGDRALINDSPNHPDGNEMLAYRKLSNGYYLMTNLSADAKRRYIEQLTELCDLSARIEM